MNQMNAEQLRRQLRELEVYARNSAFPEGNPQSKGTDLALRSIANTLSQLAARLSGVAAMPVTDAMLDAGMTALHGMRWRERLSAAQQAESRLVLYRTWTEMCSAAQDPNNV